MTVVNFTVPQGTSWGVQIPVVNPDGSPATLTGWTATSQIRPAATSSTILYSFTPTIVGNIVTIQATAADTTLWTWDTAEYDVKLSNGTQAARIIEGVITMDLEVTR
jgi:hypothetical protein